ncbi:MAG TPA: RES family NAD+ phosphorylase [Bryobacteraceae bacterium]|nr:RES family NAD+ phosphorylase [Bryobacteraceae bacterium]
MYRTTYGPGLDGIGGLFAAGRWHTRGERVVYFGGSAAIVVLERLVHIDPDLLPDDLQLGRFEFSEPVAETQAAEIAPLASNWPQDENATRQIGGRWRQQGTSCLLAVPSAILPEESNFVFNPEHPDATRLRQVAERRFTFDARLI